MTANEIRLLRLLGLVLGAALIGLGAFWYSDSLAGMARQAGLLKKQYEQLVSQYGGPQPDTPAVPLETLRERKRLLLNQLTENQLDSFYRFSAWIQEQLKIQGLEIQRLSIDEAKQELGLQAQGKLVAVLSLVDALQSTGPVLDFRSLVIQRSANGLCSMQTRIRYVVVKQ